MLELDGKWREAIETLHKAARLQPNPPTLPQGFQSLAIGVTERHGMLAY